MSGIYIPGLRVPEENEDELWIAVRSDGTVTFNAEWGWTMNKGKAVSVPPHGRLGDLDALEERVIKRKYACAGASAHGAITELHKSWGLHDAELMIEAAPTIIPADLVKEGEG